MYSILVMLVLYWFLIMICIVYVQPMYQPAVNHRFTGCNDGSTKTAIGSPFLVLKKQHPVKVL